MATKAKKLIDFIKDKEANMEDFNLKYKATEGENNSRKEILEIEKEINDQTKVINDIYHSSSFSISRLYEAETRMALLNKKLEWIKEKFAELF